MFGIILASMIAFLSTSIDDLFILTLHFATSNQKFSKKDIVYGHFSGIAILISVSLLASLPAMAFSYRFIGFFGLIPIYRGIDLIFHQHKDGPIFPDLPHNRFTDYLKKHINQNILLVATITIANGGDNLAVYFPLFSSLKFYVLLIIPLFFIYTHYWVKLSEKLLEFRHTARLIKKYGHIIIPYSMILVGIYVILRNGTLTYLFG